jgi:hypothetical protein
MRSLCLRVDRVPDTHAKQQQANRAQSEWNLSDWLGNNPRFEQQK